MTDATVSGVVSGYLEALGRRGDYGRLLAPGVVFEAPGSWRLEGAAAVEAAVRHHYEVEFDARPEVVALVADDHRAAAEIVFTGTHVGDYAGIPPTGNRVRVPLSMAFDVENGLITAIRVYYAPEQLLAQLRTEHAVDRRGPT